MNRSIRFTALFSLLLITLLLVNLTYIAGFSQEKYANNPLNKRLLIAATSIPRGAITAGGEELAHSWKDEAGIYHRKYEGDTPAFSNVLGYLSDQFGAAGLELSQNAQLTGTEITTKNWTDRLLGKDPIGNNVHLTLNPEVQRLAYHQLADNGYEGAIVALKPSTGEIIAMAASPSFDNNGLVNPETAENTWQELLATPGNPLLNHATQETLPPGSIFKIVTTAAGLANGYSRDSQLPGAAEITLPGTTQTLTNYGGQTCGGGDGGDVSLLTAFEHSCNTAFVQMSIDMGAAPMQKAATSFGIGQSYDLGIPMANGALGDITDPAIRGQSSIGQRDVSMSALQAAVMAGTVANGGQRMTPHLVSAITDVAGHEVRKIKPEVADSSLDPAIMAEITDLMRASERSTWGYKGTDIASKTGTAEHGDNTLGPHTWYVAFGPSKNADVAVAVVVKNGGHLGAGATGGQVASPLGRTVLEAALRATR
ncbi:penicillin-binding transpeptidase domain-containing protein [Corynebacterium caspium]|uniref:penicillin-binding transpeptidase domain-containing protein n=1 Tax=Corynebacterium caspium TaxID=234828 RepID=UPI000380DDDA|nr:penicillin-binding transpeptidase domain-containing protein [Corynebacterium caspium]WKD58476.1 Penicillin-binding protein A [Corynebacterium caspium DSM 44850]